MSIKVVRFLSRPEVERYLPQANSVLISIHDSTQPPPALQAGWLDVLTVRFHDIDSQQESLEVFTQEHAQAILEFAERNRACREVVVHCTMGYSRSAAVAIYLSEKLGAQCFKGQRRIDFEGWPQYNRLVYRVLRTVDHEGADHE